MNRARCFIDVIVVALLVLSAASAGAQSTPVQLMTGVAGTATAAPNVLRVALPVKNRGTGMATDVRVTAVTMRGASRLAPASFPVGLGNLAAGASLVIHASFDRAGLAAGNQPLLTVSGTYMIGGVRYGFTLNRPVAIPPDAPGSAVLRSASVASRAFTPDHFPLPSTFPVKEANPNPPGPPVPASPPRFLFNITTNASGANQGAGQPGGTGAPSFAFGESGRFAGVTGNPPDPNGASGGGVILTTVNTTAAISIDGGATFVNINPFCMFGYVVCDAGGGWVFGNYLVDGNLCCDQAVVYAPSINRFIWLMQTWPNGWPDGQNRTDAAGNPTPPGNNRVRMVVVSPQDVRNWATGQASSWITFDLSTATFGMGANQWLDWPSLAVGTTFLYMSIDQVGPGLVVARMRLDQLATVGTIGVEFTDPTKTSMSYGSHLMQNTGDTMYWAGHNGTDKLRVFDMPENTNVYSWRDTAINSYLNSDYSSNTPSGMNWLQGSAGFGLEQVTGAARRRPTVFSPPGVPPPPDELWFAWGAGRDNSRGRAHPYVEIVRIDNRDYQLREQIHVWNAGFAFGYPMLAVNSNNEIGVNLGVGGGTMEAVTAAGFLGDLLVWIPTASDCSVGRFGDWLGLRRSGNNGELFAATGYRMTNAGGACAYDPTFNEFGRFCDVHPNDASCRIIIK